MKQTTSSSTQVSSAIDNTTNNNNNGSAPLVPASLKIETMMLTKELAKFRPCDQNGCLYCREWAQWVYKKTFGKERQDNDKKGAKSSSSSSSSSSGAIAGGGGGGEPKKKHKEYAMVVCERFYQRSTAEHNIQGTRGVNPIGAGSVAAAAMAASSSSSSSSSKGGHGGAAAAANAISQSAAQGEDFVREIIDTVRDWIQQPSALYTSPEVFSLVDFEALYAGYPLQTQEQNQQQDDVTPILATLTVERAHMILGHQGYPLLKRVTKAQLQNQIMNPTCQHVKGLSKSPADLELDKELFNEELNKMRMRDQESLRKQIGPVWRHVEEALERMDGAEKVRATILSPTRGKEFAQTYKDKMASFQEVWSEVEAKVKKAGGSKKKGNNSNSVSSEELVKDVDGVFQKYIENMQFIHKQLIADVLDSTERSLREFIKELAGAQTKILKLAMTRIQEGKVGTARIDKILEESPEKCRNALKMVDQLVPIFDTKMAQFRVLVLNKLKEVDEEVEATAALYWNESQRTAHGRCEKAANKEFRKRIKKMEAFSAEIRKWFFQSRLTLVSSYDFATVCLNTLGILMEEAEVLEAVQLGLHDDHFRSRVLKAQDGRMKLAQQFREGVKTGRKVLAVMIARLMMREGARAMGEMAAIQKEKKFLKSIGQDVSDMSSSNGKSAKLAGSGGGSNNSGSPGNLLSLLDVTPLSSAQVSEDEDGTPIGPNTNKNRKKKEKKKKKAAEAAAAAAAASAGTSETSAATDVAQPVNSNQPIEDGPDLAAQKTSSSQEPPATTGRRTQAFVPIITEDVPPVLSSKAAQELKKQAKKEAKRQAKEAEKALLLEKERKEREEAEAKAREAREKAEAAEAAAREKRAKEEAEAAAKEKPKEEQEAALERSMADTTKENDNGSISHGPTATEPAKVPAWGPSATTLANRIQQGSNETAPSTSKKQQQQQQRASGAADHAVSPVAQWANTLKTPSTQPAAPQDSSKESHASIQAPVPEPVPETEEEAAVETLDTASAAIPDGPQHQQQQQQQVVSDVDSVEDLMRLPTQTLATLVHTLQLENKSLLTTLVSMQQQVSSLTERYSTLATLAREHEQQAIQAMELQKQREMEDVQRYVWKLENRCRQLEQIVLATHQHQQQQQQQQQQQHQQQQQQHGQAVTSSVSSMSMASMAPPSAALLGSLNGGLHHHIPSSSTASGPSVGGGAGAMAPPPGFGLLGLARPGSSNPSSPRVSAATLSASHNSLLNGGVGGNNGALQQQQQQQQQYYHPHHALFLQQQQQQHQHTAGSTGADSAPSSPTTMSSSLGMGAGPHHKKKTHWRQRGEVRCGNCAQLGHSSTECTAGCRYCDRSDHLSQDCPLVIPHE
ncbi:hypothetical protein BGW41_004655 [Actinomortierella wolfii]|nr:hypothetical protein BGW41_004655 [Actinomortierella wolfii]